MVTPALDILENGELQVVNMSRSNRQLYAQTSFVIFLELETKMNQENSYLNLTFSRDLFYFQELNSAIECSVNGKNQNCELIEEETKEVTFIMHNICGSEGCYSHETIKVMINQLRNPIQYYAKDTDLGNITMTTYYKFNNKEYKIDWTECEISSKMFSLSSSDLALKQWTVSSL